MNETKTIKAQKRAESDGRILQAAAKVFGRLGYGQATLTCIAAEAGVSQGLVSQRFHSKENLLLETFEQTQILSFYEEKNAHLPYAFYVLLEHLKQEAAEKPDWFRFLSMIHTGTDTPLSFEERTREVFTRTPLYSAIYEAQEQGNLPAGDPWDIFRVFFRNATNLIGWYHEFGLPMPENEDFLYAIQYKRRQKEAEETLRSQKYEIRALRTDRDILFTAVSDIYPLIIFSNLTKNAYDILEHERYPVKCTREDGIYDNLIRFAASTIPNEIHKEQFLTLFSRQNVISSYERGKKQLCLRHLQTDDDGNVHWIETRMIFQGCECGEIVTITLSRQIDDEMNRLQSYGDALQKAEIAAGAKSRFLKNLSHEIRTLMNSLSGYTQLISRHLGEPDRIRGYAEKMGIAEGEMMNLYARAIEAANLSAESNGMKIRLSVNESIGGILDNARKIAAQRGVELNYQAGPLTDDFIYADEILLQKSVMSLIFKEINESTNGGRINVKLDQPESEKEEMICLRLTIQTNGIGISEELLQRVREGTLKTGEDALEQENIWNDIQKLGAKVSISSDEKGNQVECVFSFPRG